MKLNKILFILLIVITLIIGFTFIIKNKNILKQNSDDTINIVFTTDKYYKNYLKVAIQSAYMNKKPESKYNISILCVDLKPKEVEEYKKFEHENFKINPISVSLNEIDEIGKFEVSNHVSRADLFKFKMPIIFKDYDKILYIDSDTLILNDLSDLYNTPLNNKYIAVRMQENVDIKKFWYTYDISFEFINGYIDYNCGVILFNLKKMREDKIWEKLIDSKNNDTSRTLMTQSAFNDVIPAKTVQEISPIYNFVPRMGDKKYYNTTFKNTYPRFKYKSYEDYINSIVIMHWAGFQKPWSYPKVFYANKWWKYANMIDKNWKPEKPDYSGATSNFIPPEI